MSAITDPCECPVAGYCSRYKRDIGSRFHELCKRDKKYRVALAMKYGIPVPDAPSLTLNSIQDTGSCIHRGELVRIQDCKRCSMKGKQVEVFVCNQHGREVSETSWWTGQSREDQCRTCKLYEPG